jgi:hypothetical protein
MMLDDNDEVSVDSAECLKELLGGISFDDVADDAWESSSIVEDPSSKIVDATPEVGLQQLSRNAIIYGLYKAPPDDTMQRVFCNAFSVSPAACTAKPPVQVATIPGQGNGLLATTNIRKGSIIYTERAMQAAQPSSSSVRACQHCFSSLEPMSTLTTADNQQWLPLPHLWPVPELRFTNEQSSVRADTIRIDDFGRCICQACQSLFCTESCYKGFSHQVGSCCAFSSAVQLIDDQDLSLCIRLFAYSLHFYRTTGSLEESLLQGFCGEPDDVTPLELGSLESDSSIYSLRALYQRVVNAYEMSSDEQQSLSLDYFDQTAAIAARNGVGFVTQSPFQQYYAAVLRATGGRGSFQHDTVKAQVALALGSDEGTLQRGMDREVQEKVAAHIAALFLLTARINHSCDPNACIQSQVFRDAHMDLVALRDIARGEQLTISYIATGHGVGHKSTSRRRRELQSKYMFWCTCLKCTKVI